MKIKVLKVVAPATERRDGFCGYAIFRKEDGEPWRITHCMSVLKWATKYTMMEIQKILNENNWDYEWLDVNSKSVNINNIPRV